MRGIWPCKWQLFCVLCFESLGLFQNHISWLNDERWLTPPVGWKRIISPSSQMRRVPMLSNGIQYSYHSSSKTHGTFSSLSGLAKLCRGGMYSTDGVGEPFFVPDRDDHVILGAAWLSGTHLFLVPVWIYSPNLSNFWTPVYQATQFPL